MNVYSKRIFKIQAWFDFFWVVCKSRWKYFTVSACIICVKGVRFETHSKYPRAPRAVTAQSSCFRTIELNFYLKETSLFTCQRFNEIFMRLISAAFSLKTIRTVKLNIFSFQPLFHDPLYSTKFWSRQHMDFGNYFRDHSSITLSKRWVGGVAK